MAVVGMEAGGCRYSLGDWGAQVLLRLLSLSQGPGLLQHQCGAESGSQRSTESLPGPGIGGASGKWMV